MIDALTFAHSYNAFWHTHAPTCEHFVRRLNIAEVRNFENPMNDSNTSNRALIAEYGFSVFCERVGDEARKRKRSEAQLNRSAWRIAKARMGQYVGRGLVLREGLAKEEEEEAQEISIRLGKFFRKELDCVVLRPKFAGCGFVDNSEGDVLVKETIFEIKSVDRRFRSSDIRQLIVYSALNLSSNQFGVSRMGIVNPRRGEVWEGELEEVCEEVAGVSAQDLLGAIIHVMASGEISR